jgi:tetratricopeptide (TPR) repeat protein
MAGSRDRAINTYELGLKKFPKSGPLYLERGNMEMMIKEYNKALVYYERGIEADPKFPSNYYWAAKLYLSSQEEVWGMIYGEIFMNLERNSKRTIEISKLLYNTYLSEIKIKDSTSYSVSFSSNTIHISNPKDLKEFKLPYGLKVYEPILMMCLLDVKEINMSSLSLIRERFVERFFESETYSKEYPNVLFDYQKSIKEAGHFEAYTHWMLMQGNLAEFEGWNSTNEENGMHSLNGSSQIRYNSMIRTSFSVSNTNRHFYNSKI